MAPPDISTLNATEPCPLSNATTDTSPVAYAWMFLAIEIIYKWTPIFVLIMGFIGNIMSLLVTTKRDNRKISTCVYMAGLAIVDSCVLVVNTLHLVLVGHRIGKGLGANLLFLRYV
jgi:hypothetical protein